MYERGCDLVAGLREPFTREVGDVASHDALVLGSAYELLLLLGFVSSTRIAHCSGSPSSVSGRVEHLGEDDKVVGVDPPGRQGPSWTAPEHRAGGLPPRPVERVPQATSPVKALAPHLAAEQRLRWMIGEVITAQGRTSRSIEGATPLPPPTLHEVRMEAYTLDKTGPDGITVVGIAHVQRCCECGNRVIDGRQVAG